MAGRVSKSIIHAGRNLHFDQSSHGGGLGDEQKQESEVYIRRVHSWYDVFAAMGAPRALAIVYPVEQLDSHKLYTPDSATWDLLLLLVKEVPGCIYLYEHEVITW